MNASRQSAVAAVIGNVISPLQRPVTLATGGRVSLTRKPVLLLSDSPRRYKSLQM